MNGELSLLPDCTTAPAPMRRFLDELAARGGGPARWMPTRLILQNFWVYRYQEYDFSDGRLVIKGANQSGKTVALATAIPIVLDGITRPERFDPDDSRARTLSYFLLGGANEGPPFRFDDRTATIALELQRGATGEFTTIGVGFRASRTVQHTQFWGFVVRDGRRVGRGRDVPLHHESDRRPLTRQELQELLQADARNVLVRESREDYANAVNAALFGFDELEQYRFLISILLQLRSPKLSQSQQVGNVEDALTRSLPELEESVTRQASRIVSDISSARGVIQRTREELDAAARIDKAYGYLLNQIAQEEAFEVGRHHDALREKDAGVGDAERARADASERRQRAQDAVDEAQAERERVRATLATLRELDVLDRHEELLRAEEALERKRGAVRSAERARAGAGEAVASGQARVEEVEGRWNEDAAALAGELRQASAAATAALWTNAGVALDQARQALDRARLDNREDPIRTLGAAALDEMGRARVRKLDELAERIRAEREAEGAYAAAKSAVDRAAEARTRADDALQSARRSAGGAAGRTVARIREWSRAEERLTRLDPLDLDDLEAAVVGAASPDFDAHRILAPVRERAAERRRSLQDERRVASEERAGHASALARFEEEHRAWLAREQAVPPPRRGQEAARATLAEAGVVAEPLYLAVDFAPGVDARAAATLEGALDDAGLLDALIVERGGVDRIEAVLAPEACDRWIRPPPPRPGAPSAGRPTLAAVLRPVSRALDAASVRAALDAVALDDLVAAASVTTAGAWTLGPLRGASASKPEGAQYVGEANRVRERERQIRRIEGRMEEASALLAAADEELARLDALLRALDEEIEALASIPEIAALREALAQVNLAERLFEDGEAAVADAAAEMEKAHGALREAQRARRVVAEEVPEARPMALDGVRGLGRATGDALRAVAVAALRGPALERLRKDHQGARTDLERELGRQTQAAARLQEAEAEVRSLEARSETLRRHISEAAVDVEAVLREIRELERRDAELDRIRDREIEARAGADADARHHQERLERLVREREEVSADLIRAVEALRSRLDDEPHAQTETARALFRQGDDGPIQAALRLLEARSTEGDELARRIRRQRMEANTELTSVFSDARALLVEYHPERSEERIRFRYEGQRVSPTALVERLTAVRAEHERFLDSKEHELYSEFFLREIAFKLREKIAAAEAVTAQINTLLEARPISANGEIMTIDWKPRDAEPADPDSVDYARLVSLLGHADTSILPAEDTAWIVAFFRRRVDQLTESDEAGELDQVFAEALREALDYRRWYEFRLFTKMPDRPRQRITTEGFGRRSGAGKALVIFLPFLAAAHVQYSAARADAPKLIGLDEAFERVDAENMDRMFDVLVSWEFSWIMTGHDLWGMASGLPACTTYEQKLSGNVVTPILHVWDGTRMRHSLDLDALAAEGDRVPVA